MHGNRIFGNVCSMSDTDCTIDFNRSSVSCVQSDAGSGIFDNGSGGAYQNKKMDLEDDDRNGSGTACIIPGQSIWQLAQFWYRLIIIYNIW